MQVGDLVCMPPSEDAFDQQSFRSGLISGATGELVFGLVLEEGVERHRSGKGPIRVRVLWADPDGGASGDWEPVDWLETIDW